VGVKATFLRLLRMVERGWPLPLGAIHNQRRLVALDNLVDLILTCLTHPAAAIGLRWRRCSHHRAVAPHGPAPGRPGGFGDCARLGG